ncbi:MAG: cupredoxin domain-containing protein [Candidatus Omnitrophica bacterium]|nr:cupredoxin domain-containing protein [Candidatus Omnitrophota bacterium]
MKRLFVLIGLCLIFFLQPVFAQNDALPQAGLQGEGDESPTQGQADQNPTQERVIPLEAFQYGFSPDPVVVKKGERVKLEVTSHDVRHGVYIKEYGINETVDKGEMKDIEFTADKAGTFDIICSVYCGSGHSGMKAKLIVTNE